MNVENYLARIQAHNLISGAPALEHLARLQQQHLFTVPFENLSVMLNEPIVLTHEGLYHKLVVKRRGGFCYELNGAFAVLLERLGYRVQRIQAQVHQGEAGAFGPPFDHLALLVTIDGVAYLVDVGFGDSCRSPLPMPDLARGESMGPTRADVSGAYRIRVETSTPERLTIKESTLANPTACILESTRNGQWIPQFRFTTDAYALEDFSEMCLYHRRSRASGFTRRRICTRATPTGRCTLSNDRLIITRNDKKQESRVADPDQYDRILNAYFDVRII